MKPCISLSPSLPLPSSGRSSPPTTSRTTTDSQSH
ncbi:unnamed protein product [Linum tenue]|uniref:Uncharacterized protein n=1 Tax=Linum tenue TaxID=586396 RepID=A0AAV0JDX4_9ROSI|nr:unnamed protein product [Linum tenue]